MLFSVDGVLDAYRERYGPMTKEQKQGLRFLVTRLNGEVDLERNQAAHLLGQATILTNHRLQPLTSTEPYGPRGYTRITGSRLYERFGQYLNVDLVGQPELLEDPQTAYDALFVGSVFGLYHLKRTLFTYLNEEREDFYAAARVLNQDVPAREIASVAILFNSRRTLPPENDHGNP
jgi:hypothetical protein